jgi:hypothetical protein
MYVQSEYTWESFNIFYLLYHSVSICLSFLFLISNKSCCTDFFHKGQGSGDNQVDDWVQRRRRADQLRICVQSSLAQATARNFIGLKIFSGCSLPKWATFCSYSFMFPYMPTWLNQNHIYVFYVFYVWQIYFPQSGALASLKVHRCQCLTSMTKHIMYRSWLN